MIKTIVGDWIMCSECDDRDECTHCEDRDGCYHGVVVEDGDDDE